MSKENPENVTRVGKHDVYIVRTQAGFKKVLKRFKQENELSEHFGYPRKYPSLVSFTIGYEGYHYASVRCTPLNTLLAAIAQSEAIAPKEKV